MNVDRKEIIRPTEEVKEVSFVVSDDETILYSCKTSASKVVIPSSIKKVYDGAFEGTCDNLVEVVLNDGLEEIGEDAFAGTRLTRVDFPSSLKKIGLCAFLNCNELAVVTFPEDSRLTEIGGEAFSGTKLKRFDVPASVTFLGASLFDNCEEGIQVNLPENTQLTDICGSSGIDYSVVGIPDTVKTVGVCTFMDNRDLKEIVLPQGLEYIEDSAFANSGLTRILIPAAVKHIDSYAFYGCEDLVDVIFEDGSNLEVIGRRAFEESGVTKFNIPSTVREIGDRAFYGCRNLEEITLPAVEQMGEDVFGQTSIKRINIPGVIEVNEESAINFNNNELDDMFNTGGQDERADGDSKTGPAK